MRAVRFRPTVILGILLVVAALVACGRQPDPRPPGAYDTPEPPILIPTPTLIPPPSPTPRPSPTPQPSPTVAPSPTDAPSPTPQPTATPEAPTTSPQTIQAIKDVINAANHAQELAFNNGNPSLMQTGATADYYAHLVQINQQLSQSGVSAIHLNRVEWGTITIAGTTTHATTYETWRTSFADGTTDVERDQNNYTLVFESGSWKVQADDHPGNGSNPSTPGTLTPEPTPPEQIVPAGPGQSRNWSGYVATGATFTAITASWTVPNSTGGSPQASSATWVGIGGVRSRDLIQAGTEEEVFRDGQTVYNAWYELLPESSRQVNLAVAPGDVVKVAISQQKSGDWLIEIDNQTSGKKFTTTVAYRSRESSAEWVEEAPSNLRGRVLNLDDFGSVTFENAVTTKDAKSASISGASGRPVSMIDRSGQVIALPSKLNPDGTSFTITRTGQG